MKCILLRNFKDCRFPVKRKLVIFIFLINFVSFSSEKESDIVTFSSDWLASDNIKALYKTPMGKVYQFSYSPEYAACKGIKDKKIYSLQGDISKALEKTEKTYRYTVIDFKIRIFPAISSKKNPVLNFTMTSSLQPAKEIKYYRDIQAIMRYMKLQDAEGKSKISSSWFPLSSSKRQIENSLITLLGLGVSYNPNYKIVSFRFIFDNNGNGISYMNHNDSIEIVINSNRRNSPIQTKSFGIMIEKPQISTNRESISRLIMEVSPLTVTFFNDPEELHKLAPVKIMEYPYSSYAKIFKRYRNRENPDAIYAYAMKLLKGENLKLGVELLEKVASRKEHILAMYQLGICYWRGIGVKPDLKKALHWLRVARKFGLSEAYAMSGLIMLNNSATPYISQSARNLVYMALNTYNYSYCTNPDWVMSYILYNHKASGNSVYFYDCSGKTRFWNAKNQLMHEYYKNKVDKKYIEKIFESVNIARTPQNKYYEVRIPPYRGNYIGKNGMNDLDEFISKGFIPAIYYKGQLLLNGYCLYRNNEKRVIKADASKALVLFDKGEKLGSIECGVEALHCKARLGDLKPADFTKKLDLKFADHPLYHMLKYMVVTPDAPGVKEFMKGNYEKARNIWREIPSPQNDFLLGAEGLYQFMHVGFDTKLYRVYYQKIAELIEAYGRLDKAVEKNIMPAIYLSGMYYITGKRNHLSQLKSGYYDIGCKQLSKAFDAGMLKAKYYLIRHQFYINKQAKAEWLNNLKPLRDIKDSDAWLLSADILARLNMNSNKNKVIKAYEIAGKLGNVRAWDRLGWLYYGNGKNDLIAMQKASESWKKFVSLDNEARKQDPLDPYWNKIKAPKRWRVNQDGTPFPIFLIKINRKDSIFHIKRYLDINNDE